MHRHIIASTTVLLLSLLAQANGFITEHVFQAQVPADNTHRRRSVHELAFSKNQLQPFEILNQGIFQAIKRADPDGPIRPYEVKEQCYSPELTYSVYSRSACGPAGEAGEGALSRANLITNNTVASGSGRRVHLQGQPQVTESCPTNHDDLVSVNTGSTTIRSLEIDPKATDMSPEIGSAPYPALSTIIGPKFPIITNADATKLSAGRGIREESDSSSTKCYLDGITSPFRE